MTASVQTGRALEKKNPPGSKSVLPWALVICFVIAILMFKIWWTGGGRDLILRTVHPFRVTRVDANAGTMTLVHGNHSYVVRCDERCKLFRPSSNYPMEDLGSVLQYLQHGEKLRFPILEQQTTFDTEGGHG